MDTFQVGHTLFRFPALPPEGEGGRGAELMIERRERVLAKAALVKHGRITPGTRHANGRDGVASNVFRAASNVFSTKMPAAAGLTVQWREDGETRTAEIWSPGPRANTVWAVTPDRKYVCLRYSCGEWFPERNI